ncbi:MULTISPECIES: adhesin [unclassified Serratia (in: enterobacteria)]|uniref:adhesin n=1 Tax=unclassified Serratia (in: enterobacteria) TaxID=2647522 RepID=UPI0018AAB949|nr:MULTISPECIES: adhesin [unclassified Serratia (in: enterobacteria)]
MLSTQNSLYRGLNTVTDKINANGFTWLRTGLCLLSLGAIMPSQAVTIDIGSGSQEWLGPPISGSFTAQTGAYSQSTKLDPSYAFAGISLSGSSSCLSPSQMTDIGGLQTYQIAQGIFVIPQITFSISYQLNSGITETMSGTIGKPETKGVTNTGAGSPVTPLPNSVWCLTPRGYEIDSFFKENSTRTTTVSGNWVIITDGSQQDGIYNMPSGFFQNRVIIPNESESLYIASNQVRVSTRQCSININNSIDFGEVEHNSTIRAELGRVNDSLVVGCTQSSVNPAANINVKFQSNSGFYDGEATRLSLNEGGGYITGEIAGITGVDNGACNSTGGLKFNSDPIRLGSIGTGAGNVSFPNELTWRLCSGGSTLPVGNVSASATVDVIFN